MSPALQQFGQQHVLFVPEDTHRIANESDALPLISEARSQNADWVAVPVANLAPAFFDLQTRLAGGVLQKFVNYGVRVIVLGHIDDYLARSSALRAFVMERNRGNTVWFADDLVALESMLQGSA